MENLLIINLENIAISATILDFLEHNYQISIVSNHQEAMIQITDQFHDLFLLITTEIDSFVIEIIDEIRASRGEIVPVVISLSKVDEQSEAQAFRQRVLYLIENPIDLQQLQLKLAGITKILDFINDKTIMLSTRKYDKDYRIKQIVYFERSRPRYLKIVHEENGVLLEDEIFFKGSIKNFIKEYGLNGHFVQVHQSYLVNSKCIQKYDKNDFEVILKNNKKIPLGITYYKNIKGGDHND